MEQRTIRPRIADVAREAGVSKTAVSFAFNSPDRLAPETAERIRDVAEQLGYTPHPVARMLTQRQTLTIGVLTPQALSVIFSNPFFGAFSEGVAGAAEESGYGLHFISPLRGSLAGAMSRATVDGVVAIGLSDDHPEVEQIRRAGVPIVLVDSTALPEHGSVEIDDVGGARAAAEHLIGLGHRDILVIGVEPPAPSLAMDPDGVTSRRLRGYREAFAKVGVEIPDERIVVGPASIEGGIAALNGAWEDGLRPTGGAGHERRHGDRRDARAPRPAPDHSGRRQRRRVRRHRPGSARGSPAHDGASADPSEGRRGGPPASGRRPTTEPSQSRASPIGDAPDRARLDRAGAGQAA